MARVRNDLVELKLEIVKAIMKDCGFSRKALAVAMGDRDESEVRLWLKGERWPTVENAQKMADAMGCTVNHLTGREVYVLKHPITESIVSAPGGMITIDDDIRSWDEKKRAKLAEAIGIILELGCSVLLFGKPREGSVKINLRLKCEQWKRLQQAISEGKLAHLNVVQAEPYDGEADSPDASLVVPNTDAPKTTRKSSASVGEIIFWTSVGACAAVVIIFILSRVGLLQRHRDIPEAPPNDHMAHPGPGRNDGSDDMKRIKELKKARDELIKDREYTMAILERLHFLVSCLTNEEEKKKATALTVASAMGHAGGVQSMWQVSWLAQTEITKLRGRLPEVILDEIGRLLRRENQKKFEELLER